MADQALLFGAAGRTDDGEVLSDFEVDYTPPAVAVQMLLALLEEVGERFVAPCPVCENEEAEHDLCLARCPSVLDPSAGSGVWARAARAILGESTFIAGAEPRESERANVVAAHNLGIVCDFDRALALEGPLGGTIFDLVISNPPFSAFKRGWWLDLLRSDRLHSGSVVAFLGLSQWGQSEEAADLLAEWAPSLQLRAGGRIAYRGDGKADAREHSLWAWLVGENERPKRRKRWAVEQLPVLPAELRRWEPSAVPGTYPIDKALVERVRSDYL